MYISDSCKATTHRVWTSIVYGPASCAAHVTANEFIHFTLLLKNLLLYVVFALLNCMAMNFVNFFGHDIMTDKLCCQLTDYLLHLLYLHRLG